MVTLSKIIDGLEMVDDIVDCYYNPNKDEIFLSNIGEYGDLSEDEIDELFEESIILPTQYEINEYQIVADFIETIESPEINNNLQRLIQGKGAFRRFKDYCAEMNIIQEWYKYRDEQYKEIAIDWCKQNKLEYKYTEYEMECLTMDLLAYYDDPEMDLSEEEKQFQKPLEDTKVSREEYNLLLDKVQKINEQL